MADTNNKKSTNKKEVKKDTAVKKSCSYNSALKFISTVIISSVVTASIIMTTSSLKDKTVVNSTKTETAPNNIKQLLDEADTNLTQRVEEFEEQFLETFNSNTNQLMTELDNVKETLYTELKQKKEVSKDSIKSKMFSMAFYNMYDKALKGYNYSHELDLMLTSSDTGLQESEGINWIKAYKDKPPVSIKALGQKIEKNYSHIIIENIKETKNGLQEKIAVAINTIVKIKPPVNNLEQGTLKYNLSKFLIASEANNTCQAMRYGTEIAKQSSWFKNNILNELEARWKINKQLKIMKKNIEQSTYNDMITSTEKAEDK